ncbi:recombinase family protein [Pseudomonas protegens]|uniref:recombinase family protein n=1 Tax=Pseudomonas protegens TaxID=380021 RepID=UPI0023EAB503|nr:recombinase family protein [Pseudomonas protegens]MDF4211155.1 recombinase family protein [Pseudomonas protegens]
MFIGYARVSKTEQNLDMQMAALKKAGCQKIFTDKASGRSHRNPGLKKAIRALSKGDTLVAWSLDRLGRTMKGLIDLSYLLNHRQINLQFLIEQMDTTTPHGRYMFNLKAATAVYELERNRERTMAGLAVAREAGRIGGRRLIMTEARRREAAGLLSQGLSRKQIAQTMGVSITSIYRHLPLGSEESANPPGS